MVEYCGLLEPSTPVKTAKEGIFTHIYSGFDGQDALRLYKQYKPEFVLLDVEIPRMSGLLVAQQILKSKNRTKILMMTAFENETTICSIKNLYGISGCILKSEHALDDYIVIIRKVMNGDLFFSSTFSHLVYQYLSSNLYLARVLSPKQRKLLCYVGAGYRDEQIADLQKTSFNTVRGQVRRLREKLGAVDRGELVSIAHDKGCVKSNWKKMDLIGNYEIYD